MIKLAHHAGFSLLLTCLVLGRGCDLMLAETNTGATQSGWRQVDVEGPPGRWVHATAYDPDGNRVLIFGGADDQLKPIGDLWEFSLDTETWTEIEQSGSFPSPRYSAALVSDPPRQRMILFGGYTSQAVDETWAFSFATQRWSRLPSGPPARFQPAMVAGPNKAWMFAGFNNFEELRGFNDLWELDLRTDTWRQLPGGVRPPAGRANFVFGFDAPSNKLYLFGGHARKPPAFRDTWSYDLTTETWTLLSLAGEFPDAVTHQAFAFDPACRSLFVMGGDNYDEDPISVSTTWALKVEPLRFMRIDSAEAPAPRGHTSMTVDSLGRLVLFGGSDNEEGQTLYDDTWIFERSESCP